MGSGRTAVQMSVTMLMLAFENLERISANDDRSCQDQTYHIAFRFMQVPFRALSQKKATGVHAKIALKNVPSEYAMTTPMRMKQAIRVRVPGKTRKYWSRMESLVRHNEG